MTDQEAAERRRWYDKILRFNDDNDVIPANSAQLGFIKTFRGLIESTITPQAAAVDVQGSVKSLSDLDTIIGYTYALGLLRHGWYVLSSYQYLAKLANFTIEATRLPEIVELIDGWH
jgi:hypothetical protein